jgi:energy-coupling factor transport system substrate-specific component
MSDSIMEHGTGESRERKVIRAALFTALSVALGFLLAAVPNVELMTLSVFLAGVFCGPRAGVFVGVLSESLFSMLNPLGPALPPLLAAQLMGFGLVGLAGGLLGPRLRPGRPGGVAASALAGFILTLIYDALTNAATAFIALGPRRLAEGIGGVFVAGILFMVIHVGVNTAVFAAAVLPVVRVAHTWQRGGGR